MSVESDSTVDKSDDGRSVVSRRASIQSVMDMVGALEIPELIEDGPLVTMRFSIEFNGSSWLVEVDLDRSSNPNYRGAIKLRILDPQTSEMVAQFNTSLLNHKGETRSLIYTRRIERNYRRQGLAELSIGLVETLSRQISQKYPDLDIKAVEIYTMLGSLSGLIVDQEWLRENGLEELQSPSGRDMGYVPEDDEVAKIVLQKNAEELADLDPSGSHPEASFVKRI